MTKRPKLVFSDFDGTLTHGQALRPVFFEILDLLKENKIELVIVTGRSKSWAHFLLSHFPTLNYAITEGGGVLTTADSKGHKHNLEDSLYVDEIHVRRLEAMTEKLFDEFPDVQLSADSFGRQTDRAIELEWLNEHPKRSTDVVHFLKKENINYSTSNVHLNFWCGEISKANAIQQFLKEHKNGITLAECVFFGDSLNDESVFKELPHTVGVSNISEVEAQLVFKPTTILLGKENEGPYGVLHYLKEVLA